MNNNQLLNFFSLQRQIFGVCPNTGKIFRLSECQIYTKVKPAPDWYQKIEQSHLKIDKAEERLFEKEYTIRENANEVGRKEAIKVVRKLDRIFTPMKLNPDDSKVLFHPVDFVVFNGMKKKDLKNIIILDRKEKDSSKKLIQRNIERVIEKGNYEWITLRVREDGTFQEE